MSKRKKIVLISILAIAVIFLLFTGYHYVKYLQATSRMKELSADLEKRLAEWEKKEFKRSPLFGPVIKGNAAEFYQEAESKLVDTSSDGWMQVADTVWKPSIPISPDGKVYYEKNKPFIEIVRKGTRAETYKSLINLREGLHAKTPHIVKIRNVANLMVLQARELDNAGQTSETIKELCDIIQFGDDYLHYGVPISAMIGLAVSEIGEEETHRFITSDKLTEPKLNELLGYLKTLIDSYPTMQDTWEGGKYGIESELGQIAKARGFLPTLKPLFRDRTTNGSDFLFNRTDYVEAWEDYIVIVEEVKRISRLPYPQAKEQGDKLTDRIKKLKNPVGRMMMPNIVSGVICYQDSLAVRRGIYILTALQIYKIRHGVYPEKLSALATEIMPEIPLDPFSDKPFIYKLDKNGRVILYSVGMNSKDDNGDKREDLLIAPYLRWSERK